MKYEFNKILGITLYLGISLLIVFTFSCCRISKHSSSSMLSSTEKTETITATRTDSTRTERTDQDSTVTVVNTEEYSRTTIYSDNGGISSIQEQWRKAGSAQLSVSTGRTSEVSVKEEKTDSTSTISEQVSATVKEESKNDSRPVQGLEWFWIIAALAAVAIVIVGIIYLKRK